MTPFPVVRSLAFGLALPTAALAHTGPESSGMLPSGLLQGFAHPWSGADHLLAMLAVGLMASRFDGRAKWVLPVSFLSFMAVGGLLGAWQLTLPFVEAAIALSLVAFGVALASRRSLPAASAAILVGTFAVFHGHAHGTEMALGSSILPYGLGFLVATAMLHAGGFALGSAIHRWTVGSHRTLRIGATALIAAGVGSFAVML